MLRVASMERFFISFIPGYVLAGVFSSLWEDQPGSLRPRCGVKHYFYSGHDPSDSLRLLEKAGFENSSRGNR
jgi:hypothetical protein